MYNKWDTLTKVVELATACTSYKHRFYAHNLTNAGID